tara:strand:+ start:2718 stop:3074 length:357 start_codon:yes stop_codon:yes gene_type:complete
MADKLSIKGRVIKILDTVLVSEKFVKRGLVIETDDTYQQSIKIDFTQSTIVMLDDIKEGQVVDVFFNLRGNEWQGKYYVNLNGWRIDVIKDIKPIPKASVEPKSVNESQNEYGDDLPF